jgi:hypothetical protein
MIQYVYHGLQPIQWLGISLDRLQAMIHILDHTLASKAVLEYIVVGRSTINLSIDQGTYLSQHLSPQSRPADFFDRPDPLAANWS